MNDIFKTLSSTTVDDIADYAIGQDNQLRKHEGLKLLLSIWKRERLEAALNSAWYKELHNGIPSYEYDSKFTSTDNDITELKRDENYIPERCRVTGQKLYYVYTRINESQFSFQRLTSKKIEELYNISKANLYYHVGKGSGFTNGVYVSKFEIDFDNNISTKYFLNNGFDNM